jgi:hypothetical protein
VHRESQKRRKTLRHLRKNYIDTAKDEEGDPIKPVASKAFRGTKRLTD